MKIKKLLSDIKKLEEAEPGLEAAKAAAIGLIKQLMSTISTSNQNVKYSLDKVSSAKGVPDVIVGLQNASHDINVLSDRLRNYADSLRQTYSKYLDRR